MSVEALPLEDLVIELERVIAALDISDAVQDTSASAFRMVDKLSGATEFSAGSAHLGVSVHVDDSENTDRLRDDVVAEIADDVRIRLLYQLKPGDQKASRNEAFRLERVLRVAMTQQRGKYRSSERTLLGAWLTIDQVFRFERYADVAGGL